MAFENLKDELKENAIELWGRIQESPAYNNVRERYENLSPNAQRGLLAAIVVLAVAGLIMFPYSYFSSSSDNTDQYIANRNLIRELLRANRLAGESLNMPRTVDAGDLKSQVSEMLAAYPLLPEQNGGTTDIDLSDLGPGVAAGKLQVTGVGVKLKKLNLKQIVEIGTDLQSKNPNVKLVGLEMTASTPDPHYFDVLYKLAVYSLPSAFGGGGKRPMPGEPPKFRKEQMQHGHPMHVNPGDISQ